MKIFGLLTFFKQINISGDILASKIGVIPTKWVKWPLRQAGVGMIRNCNDPWFSLMMVIWIILRSMIRDPYHFHHDPNHSQIMVKSLFAYSIILISDLWFVICRSSFNALRIFDLLYLGLSFNDPWPVKMIHGSLYSSWSMIRGSFSYTWPVIRIISNNMIWDPDHFKQYDLWSAPLLVPRSK